MNDLDLRGALRDAVHDVGTPDLARDAWQRGKRRRRWRAASAVGGVAVVTGAVVLTVAILNPGESVPVVTSSPTPTPTITSTDATLADLYTQVRHMPELGDRNGAPTFVRDGRLWYGPYPMMQGVPGTVRPRDVIVGHKTGWLIQFLKPEVVAGRLGPMGGDFEPFAVQDRENPNVFAASPDGKYIVMGESLLNGDGQRIGPLPLTNVASTQAWTPAGLVYIDQVGKFWLWNVESPQALPLPRFDNVNTDGWTISEKGDCSYVGRLQATGAVKSVFQHCGDQVVSLSPGWAAGPRLALTASGKVYDTASGSLVQRLDLPTGLTELSDSVHLQYGGWWRGSSSNDVPPLVFLSFTIDLTRIYDDVDLDHRYASVIIGCQVTTGDCGQQFRSEVDNPEVPFVWR